MLSKFKFFITSIIIVIILLVAVPALSAQEPVMFIGEIEEVNEAYAANTVTSNGVVSENILDWDEAVDSLYTYHSISGWVFYDNGDFVYMVDPDISAIPTLEGYYQNTGNDTWEFYATGGYSNASITINGTIYVGRDGYLYADVVMEKSNVMAANVYYSSGGGSHYSYYEYTVALSEYEG